MSISSRSFLQPFFAKTSIHRIILNHLWTLLIVSAVCCPVSLTAQTQAVPGNACNYDSGCSSPAGHSFVPIRLPEYPGCTLYLEIMDRYCGNNRVEFEILGAYWDYTPGDTTCADLEYDWISAPSRGEFMRDLIHKSISWYAKNLFVSELGRRKNIWDLDPTNPIKQLNYQVMLCGGSGGWYTVEAHLASCMIAAGKVEKQNQSLTKDAKGAALLRSPSRQIND